MSNTATSSDGRQIWPAVIAAVGAVAGGAISAKGSRDAANTMSENNQFALADQYSNGQFSDYMENYAYRSPSEQGAFERERMAAMFPELNAWELSGASGVGGAMPDAGAIATQTAATDAQIEMQSQQMKQQADLAMAKNVTDVAIAGVNAEAQNKSAQIAADASVKNTELQTDTATNTAVLAAQTSTSNVRHQMKPVYEKLNSELDVLDGTLAEINSRTELNNANTINQIQQNSLFALQEAGIQLNNEQTEELTNKIKAEIQSISSSRSVAGGIAHDAVHWSKRGYDKVIEIRNRITKTIDETLDKFINGSGIEVKGILTDVPPLTEFQGGTVIPYYEDSNMEGVGSASSVKKPNNVRTHR